MRGIAVFALAAAIAAGSGMARADVGCVTIAKGTTVYSRRSRAAAAGRTTSVVQVAVDARHRRGWLIVHATRLESSGDGFELPAARIEFAVRARDARRTRCPPEGKPVAVMKLRGSDDVLRWPDGITAGWANAGDIRPEAGASTEPLAGATHIRCFTSEHFAGLRFKLCVEPASHGE